MYAHLRNLSVGLGGWVVCAHLRNACGWLGTHCWHDRIDTGCNPLRSRVAVAADEVATKSIKFTMILQQRICNKTNCNAGDTRGYKTWGVRFAYQTIRSCYFSKRLSFNLSVMNLTLLSYESRGHVEVAGGLSSFSTKSIVVCRPCSTSTARSCQELHDRQRPSLLVGGMELKPFWLLS